MATPSRKLERQLQGRPDRIAAVEAQLRRDRDELRLIMRESGADSPDDDLKLARVLRPLICDHETGGRLQAYAATKGVTLPIWGPRPAGNKPPQDLAFAWSAVIAEWDNPGDGHQMTIDEYLDTPVAVLRIAEREAAGRHGGWTPRELIKDAAEKRGAMHLDFERDPMMDAVRRMMVVTRGGQSIRDANGRRAMYAIAAWAVHAIDYVLGEGAEPGGPFRVMPPPER